MHHCAARSRHGSHSRQCHYSLLQRQLAAVLMRAGRGRSWLRWTGPAASHQSPEPLVRTVDGDSDRAVNRIELNWIDSFVALTRIESNRFLFCRIAHHKFIRNDGDRQTLQKNFNKLQKWSNQWQLQLNAAKCKIISFGRGDVAEYEYTITSQNLAVPLGRDKFISDWTRYHDRPRTKIYKSYKRENQ